MTIKLNTRLLATALFAALGFSLAAQVQQEPKVRSKVKVNLSADPSRDAAVVKTVYGDDGSFVALKIKAGQTVLGGVPQSELGWSMHVIGSDKMTEIKHDSPKFIWGIGPVALETIETFNKQFRAILSKPDAAHGQLLLLQEVLSPRSLTGRAAALVAKVPYDRFGKNPEYFKPGMAVGFTTTLAKDGKHMLIGLSPKSTVRAAGCPILGVMVDGKMKPLWTNTLATNPGNVRTNLMDTKVDGKGAAWYLVKNVSDPAPKVKGQTGFNITLYRLDSAGQKDAVLDLGKEYFAQDAAFDFLPDGTVVCAGIYSNHDASSSESIGVFRTTLDPATMQWAEAVKTPFEKQVVKKIERLQTNMHVEHIWPKTDGDLFVVTERSGIETHQVSDLSGKKIDKTEWVNGAFHVMDLKKSGEPKWYVVVPREMSFANNGPGKAFSIDFGDVLFLFFNDDAKNTELRKQKQPVEAVDKPKDALKLEFKGDGRYKEKVVLVDGYKHGYFDADAVWPMGHGLYGLNGAPDFRKDRTFPVLIELSKDERR